MLVVRTIESATNSVGKLVSSQHSIGLDDLALAVDPLGLYGVKPWTPLRQKVAYDPYSTAAVLDLAVMSSQPAPELFGDVPRGIVPDENHNLLPRASSFSAHHERNRVVMELTGLPSTNLIHVSSSSGR
jgi:hypothetical protein